MIKALKIAGLALLAFFPTWTVRAATVSTQTNVLENISLQFTIYEEGSTNANGTKITAKPVSYSTKNFIAALQTVTGQSFGPSAKLVENLVFSNVIITNFSSNNLAVQATNPPDIYIGTPFFNFGTNVAVLSNSTFILGSSGSVSTNVAVYAFNTNEAIGFFTNAGYETTFTPSTNSLGQVTNITIVSQKQGTSALTESLFTNIGSSIEVLYGKTNALYPVDYYIGFATNSAIIVTETGTGLGSNNPTAPSLSSQNGYSISNMVINYFSPLGSTNLYLNLEGFVKQALKVDVLSRKGTNIVIEDIFGASSTWNVIGSGYVGGTFSTNPPGIAVSNLVDGIPTGGYLTNTAPVVVQGTVNISFLKNLAQ